MSLFSTITHGETPLLKGVSPRGVGAFALVLVIGMALGYAFSTIDFGAESVQTPVAGLDHGRFLEVNTIDLEWLEPVAVGASTSRAVSEVDPFIWANVGSYGALNAPWTVDEAFAKANLELPLFGPYDTAQTERLSEFTAVNVASYEGLIQIWEDQHTAGPGFVAVNTELPETYVEPKSGPR